jgi:hypothetical protein
MLTAESWKRSCLFQSLEQTPLMRVTNGFFNVVRNISAEGFRSILSWAWCGKDPHRPLRFGKVTFKKATS